MFAQPADGWAYSPKELRAIAALEPTVVEAVDHTSRRLLYFATVADHESTKLLRRAMWAEVKDPEPEFDEGCTLTDCEVHRPATRDGE